MQNTLAHGAYRIISIIATGGTLELLIAENEAGEKFVVNKLKSSDRIKEILPSVMELAKREGLLFSQESDGICILTPYAEGEELSVHLSIHNPSLPERIRLAREYLMRLIQLEVYPKLLKESALCGKHLIVSRSTLCVNLFAKEDEEAEPLSAIIASFFTEKQRKRNEALKLILDKLERGVFSDIREVTLSFQRLQELINDDIGGSKRSSRTGEKALRLGKRLLRIAAILLALFVLYEMVTALRTGSGKKYEPVRAIGTVVILEETAEPVKEPKPGE